jgi:hypothetical protein
MAPSRPCMAGSRQGRHEPLPRLEIPCWTLDIHQANGMIQISVVRSGNRNTVSTEDSAHDLPWYAFPGIRLSGLLLRLRGQGPGDTIQLAYQFIHRPAQFDGLDLGGFNLRL